MEVQAHALPCPWLTCDGALTEAFYLLGKKGAPQLKELLRRQVLKPAFVLDSRLERVLDLMDKYADRPMSLADACLVRMTETLTRLRGSAKSG